jgi:beta-lactam-binding protein with PASTA domain
MFRFLAKRPLWQNVLFAIGFVFVLVMLFLFSLDWLTKHGRSLTVPAVTGKTIMDAEKLLDT